MLWGILAQSIPDIDFLDAAWLNTPDALLAHRGFTHSIFFALLITPILGFFAERLHRPHNISFRRWCFFFAAAILLHIFLDGFNNYGVGWFEPFTHYRVSFNIIYVADPFFSIMPGLAFFMLLVLRRKNPWRKFWWKAGLGISLLYLGYCTGNKIYITQHVKRQLASQHIVYTKLLTTPAPLQSWLWFIAAGTDSGFYVGYRSVFDKKKEIDMHYFPQQNDLLSLVKDEDEIKKLKRFSQGFYTAEQHGDSIVFNDLRFGQITGWQNPQEQFVFHYYIQPETDNTLVVQRGRFAKWDKQVFRSFLHRIRGN